MLFHLVEESAFIQMFNLRIVSLMDDGYSKVHLLYFVILVVSNCNHPI